MKKIFIVFFLLQLYIFGCSATSVTEKSGDVLTEVDDKHAASEFQQETAFAEKRTQETKIVELTKEDAELLLWSYYKQYTLYEDENSEILGIRTDLNGGISLLMAGECYEKLSESLEEQKEEDQRNQSPVDGIRKVNVHRADKKILSLLIVSHDDDGKAGYTSRTYDVVSGRELELTELINDMDSFRKLVEEQLPEKELGEKVFEVWTAGYEGVTVYLQTEKSKAVPVMISYKEYPELFRKDMS